MTNYGKFADKRQFYESKKVLQAERRCEDLADGLEDTFPKIRVVPNSAIWNRKIRYALKRKLRKILKIKRIFINDVILFKLK